MLQAAFKFLKDYWIIILTFGIVLRIFFADEAGVKIESIGLDLNLKGGAFYSIISKNIRQDPPGHVASQDESNSLQSQESSNYKSQVDILNSKIASYESQIKILSQDNAKLEQEIARLTQNISEQKKFIEQQSKDLAIYEEAFKN